MTDVTQEDREAAADIVLIREPDGVLAGMIRKGEADNARTVQIVATHREAAARQARVEALLEAADLCRTKNLRHDVDIARCQIAIAIKDLIGDEG